MPADADAVRPPHGPAAHALKTPPMPKIDPDALPQTRTFTPKQARAAMIPLPPAPFQPSPERVRDGLDALLGQLLVAARGEASDAFLSARLTDAHAIGFDLEIWQVGASRYWALFELAAERRGAGSYVLRVSPPAQAHAEVILQTPHVFFDRGTSNIAAEIFFGSIGPTPARGFYVNTAHRYGGPDSAEEDREDSESDVCHIDAHEFHTATDVAARVLPSVIFVQLHGYADQPKLPTVIISSGDQPSPLVRAMADELRAHFDAVGVYPDDVSTLGGTQNAQRQLLDSYPHAEFVHLELSADTRKALRRSPALRAALSAVLLRERTLGSADPAGTSDRGADQPAQPGPEPDDTTSGQHDQPSSRLGS